MILCHWCNVQYEALTNMADTDNLRQSSDEELEINQSETGTFILFFISWFIFGSFILFSIKSAKEQPSILLSSAVHTKPLLFSFRLHPTPDLSPTGSLMFRWPQKTQELEKQENESTNETVSKQRNRFIRNRIGPLVLCSA